MIEIRKTGEEEDGSGIYELFIDGSRVNGASVDYFGAEDETDKSYTLITTTITATNQLIAHSFTEVHEAGIHTLQLHYEVSWLEVINALWFFYDFESQTYSITFMFNRLSRWSREYPFADYYRELVGLMRDSEVTGLKVPFKDEDLENFLRTMPIENFILRSQPCSPAVPIVEEVARCINILLDFHTKVEKELESRLYAGSVVVSFDFPEEVRVPCEQYLLYFVQFLKDIGVEATAELQHEAGEVLFAVTPADKEEALDKIRAALDTYLHLAASPVNSASVLSTDIEVQRLSANIQHLQGQLTLAHAVLQAKDATIQLQQTTIAQQRQMLTGEIILESMKNVTPKPKDTEEVLGGLAEITKYEGKGFNLNLPEAFRRLRQLFSEKKGEKK